MSALLPRRSPQERIERFVGDCLHLIIQTRENALLDAKEQALKDALKLLPDIEPERHQQP